MTPSRLLLRLPRALVSLHPVLLSGAAKSPGLLASGGSPRAAHASCRNPPGPEGGVGEQAKCAAILHWQSLGRVSGGVAELARGAGLLERCCELSAGKTCPLGPAKRTRGRQRPQPAAHRLAASWEALAGRVGRRGCRRELASGRRSWHGGRRHWHPRQRSRCRTTIAAASQDLSCLQATSRDSSLLSKDAASQSRGDTPRARQGREPQHTAQQKLRGGVNTVSNVKKKKAHG